MPDLQRLIDLPYYGSAAAELRMTEHWDEADYTATRQSPLELVIRYEGGISCSDCGHDTVIVRAS